MARISVMRNNQFCIVALSLAVGFIGCGGEDFRWEQLLRGEEPDPNAIVIPLIAGRHTVVGQIQVWRDGDDLHVQYDVDGGWELTQTDLALGQTLVDIPRNHKGCPKVGQFSWSEAVEPTDEYDVVLSLEEAGLDDAADIVIAAHAEVRSKPHGKKEGVWAEGSRFPGCRNIAQYFTAHLSDPVDLAVVYFKTFPSTIHAGDVVVHWMNIANAGIEPFDGPVVARFWLSQDMIFGGDTDIGDPLIFDLHLEPGAVMALPYDFAPVIAEEGQYWIFAEIQPQDNLDSNPANNVLMDADPLVITDAPLPSSDLTVNGLKAVPPVLGPGEPFTAEWKTSNLGPQPFDGVLLFRYWLSEDLLPGPGDIPVGSLKYPKELAVGQSVGFGPHLVLPAVPAGDYNFIVQISTYLGGMDPNLANQTTATPVTVTP